MRKARENENKKTQDISHNILSLFLCVCEHFQFQQLKMCLDELLALLSIQLYSCIEKNVRLMEFKCNITDEKL